MSDSTDSTDSGSGYSFSDIIKTATNVVNAGATAYKTVTGSGTPASAIGAAKSATGAPATTATGWKQYLPYILGGVALLAVGFFVFRRK
ncbi:MAG: hypothetical protein ACXWIU_02295 [Limisphaerales bacterium]